MTNSIKLVLAEDQALLNNALASLLNLEADIDVVATAKDGREAIALVDQYQPDIVLTDIEMPIMSGLDVAEEVKDRKLNTKIIIVTTFGRAGYLRRAMDAGVRGFLLKDASTDDIAAAIRKVMAGRKVIDPELITDAWETTNPLSKKERVALQLAKQGMSTEQIANNMHLSPGTVRNYLSQALHKLDAANRIEAARIAHQKGWL